MVNNDMHYQVIFLGSCKYTDAVKSKISSSVEELGLRNSDILFINETTFNIINRKAPVVAIFFGYNDAKDSSHSMLNALLSDSVPIITCVDDLNHVATHLPESLRHINAFPLRPDKPRFERLVTLVMENLRLLRMDRGVFISYKRSESQAVAVQLYEALDAAGFNVFLDTRSVPYAKDFQSVLWHRMADSDIVILLDTPKFRESHWTQEELAQANTTNIQILHLLWPSVDQDETSAFSVFSRLSMEDFKTEETTGESALLSEVRIGSIVQEAEKLRARALAARHRSLVDNFCDIAREHSANSVSVQPQRYISVQLANGNDIAVVPTIGVPRADRYHDVEDVIKQFSKPKEIWLLYDERGILDRWISHLDWLNTRLGDVIAVKSSDCIERLR